jgi:uncharacterized NAD(P)/FAD-binding protein YdhS
MHITIIGGGFSGAMVVANLIRHAGTLPLRLTLIETRPEPAKGVAYSTTCPLHLLNVRAGQMSAWPDRPDDLVQWVRQRQPHADPRDFIQRSLFGEYAGETFARAVGERPATVSFEHVRARCIRLVPRSGVGVDLHLDNGTQLHADRAVLALGNLPPSDWLGASGRQRYLNDPWSGISTIPSDQPVFLIGTGLTMVDVVLELMWRKHNGPVHAVSRHGFLPQSHLVDPKPAQAEYRPAELMGSVRQAVGVIRRITHRDDWQGGIDALRPHSVAIWQSWPISEQQRFLRHARAHWDIHRHRIAPQVAESIRQQIGEGRLTVQAGRIQSIRDDQDGATVTIRLRGGGEETRQVGCVVNCSGPNADLIRSGDQMLQGLLREGHIVADELRQGAVTAENGELVDAGGKPSDVLFTLGTLRKPAMWESIAVPELRVQAEMLARHLAYQA